jgi:hypothetical protein
MSVPQSKMSDPIAKCQIVSMGGIRLAAVLPGDAYGLLSSRRFVKREGAGLLARVREHVVPDYWQHLVVISGGPTVTGRLLGQMAGVRAAALAHRFSERVAWGARGGCCTFARPVPTGTEHGPLPGGLRRGVLAETRLMQ